MAEDAYRVLVVDDDPDVALHTSTVLERRAGCIVQAICDGNRIAERWLVPKALIAMTFVTVLVVVREVFFA